MLCTPRVSCCRFLERYKGRFREAPPRAELSAELELTLFTLLTAIPCISDCVLAELEKLGQKYRLALR